MNKNILIIAGLILWLGTLAALGQHPDYDATYLSVKIECNLNADHSMEYRYAKVQKLHTYRSFHNLYGETFVTYNPVYQKLKINEAYTVMANGTKVTTPDNAFNEVLPRFAANAPDFNSLREMVITHTGLEKEATIHLDYSITSGKDFEPFFTGDELLADVEPVKEMVISVKIPAGTPFSYRLFNIQGKPAIAHEGGFTTYTWRFTDLPVISAEEFQAGGSVLYPHLFFSTTQSYKELYTRLMEQDAFRYNLNSKMKEEVGTLVKENSDKLQLALKLQEKVINEFNLVSTPMVFTGYRLRTPEQVWSGNYGRVAEKALLLTSLLKDAGITARPVAVVRTATLDMKVPVIQGIEDVLVEVSLPEGKPLYLSVSSMQQQGLHGKSLISMDPASAGEIVTVPELNAVGSAKYTLFITSDLKLTGSGKVTLENGYNPWLSLVRDKSKLKGTVTGGIKSADIKEINQPEINADRTTFELTIQKENPLRKDTSFWMFSLPALTNGADGWGIKTLPAIRKTAFELPSAGTESLDLTLTLPENLKLFTQVGRTEISNAAGSFIYDLSYEGGKVIIHKEIQIKKESFAPKEYAAMKVLLDNWNLPATREILLTGK